MVHLLRDAAWILAIALWLLRRLFARTTKPSFSMRPRLPTTPGNLGPPAAAAAGAMVVHPARAIALIPAHNEAANLHTVVGDLTSVCPSLDIVIVDDGSTDATAAVLARLGVAWIHFDERMGIGSAVRAGLQYTVRLGYDVAVRVDGDGQHGAADIERLLAPVLSGEADVVLGTRYAVRGPRSRGRCRPLRLALATCLTALTGRRVTDPTSGFCAFSARAMRLLAEHHPAGYAEPELRLFLSRNGLRVCEVPVGSRPRLGGTTSLTPPRILGAAARLALALLIVPLRAAVIEPAGD